MHNVTFGAGEMKHYYGASVYFENEPVNFIFQQLESLSINCERWMNNPYVESVLIIGLQYKDFAQ